MHEPPIGEGSLMFLPHYNVLLCFYNWTDNGKLNAPKHLENRRVGQIQSFEVCASKFNTFLKKTNENQ